MDSPREGRVSDWASFRKCLGCPAEKSLIQLWGECCYVRHGVVESSVQENLRLLTRLAERRVCARWFAHRLRNTTQPYGGKNPPTSFMFAPMA